MEGKSSCCTHCGKMFGRRASLNSHQKVCEAIKHEMSDSTTEEEYVECTKKVACTKVKVLNFSCDLCGKSFKQKRALQSHVKVCNAAALEDVDQVKKDHVEHLRELEPSALLDIKSEVHAGQSHDPDLANVTVALDDAQEADNENGYDSGGDASPIEEKRMYNKYTRSLKLEVIAHAKVHGKNSASRKFNVPNTSVRRWVSSEKQIKKAPRMKCGRELRAMRNVPSTKLELDLKKWILERHQSGEQLTKEQISEKAQILSNERNLTKFNPTRTWYFAFLNRHKLDSIVDVCVPNGEVPDLPGKAIVRELTCDKCGLIFKYRQSLRSHVENCLSEIDKELLKRSKENSSTEIFTSGDETDTYAEFPETTSIKHKRKKNSAYENKYKIKVIDQAKKLGNRSAARKHRISESLIRKWIGEECTIRYLPPAWNTLPRKVSQVRLIKSRIEKKYSAQRKMKALKRSTKVTARKNYREYTCNICKEVFKVRTVFECHVENCSAEVALREEAKKMEIQQKLAQIKERNKNKKKNTFPAGFKLQLIQEAKLKGTTHVARKYNLNIATINRWRHREKILEKLPKEKVICLGGSKFPLLESRLRDWILANSRLGKVMIRSLIKRKACTFSESMKLYDFMCSDSWLKKFFQRSQITDIVRVITNIIPYICDTCGKSLKTDMEFERHMTRCNPSCINYVTVEAPEGSGDSALLEGSMNFLANDLQSLEHQEMDEDNIEDDDVGNDLPPPLPLSHQGEEKLVFSKEMKACTVPSGLNVKQELVFPEERSTMHVQGPVRENVGTSHVSDEVDTSARLRASGHFNAPQMDRLFEFLDHVTLAPCPDKASSPVKDVLTPGKDNPNKSLKASLRRRGTMTRSSDRVLSTSGVKVGDDSGNEDMADMAEDIDDDDFNEVVGGDVSDTEDEQTTSPSLTPHAQAMAKIGPFTCGVCARVFNFKHSYDKHMRYHATQTKYECHICEATFAFKMQLLSHVESHKKSKKPAAPAGEVGGSGKATDQEHMCERCGRYLKGGASYRYHMKLHFREDQSKCPNCSEESLCTEHFEEYKLHLDSTLTRPLSFKLKMIDLAKQGVNKSELAQKYDVAPNSLRKWLGMESKLREAEAKRVENFSLKRKYDFPQLENRLVTYLIELYNGGEGITNNEMQEKARRIAVEIGMESFKPTIPWLASFKERFKDIVPMEVFNKKKAVRGSRKSYTLLEKAQIVEKTDEIGVGKTCKQLGLPRSTIRKWVKQKRLIFSQVYDNSAVPYQQHVPQPSNQLVQNYEETVVHDGSFLMSDILNQGF